MVYQAVTWMFVCALVLAFVVAYGIGANDVANSFGSSVGARALSMKQAIVLASICEFSGAVLMGSSVTETIRTGIAKLEAFSDSPDVLAYGMLCALLASGIWLLVATFWELPVSTTHSIVGAIIGMTMIAVGPSAVLWSSNADTFPYIGGVASLCASWITSPILGAVLSCFCFWLLRTLVLRHDNAYQRAFYVLPLVVFIVAWFITIFTIKESTQRWELHETSYATASWIGVIVGAVATAIAIAWQIYHVKRRVDVDLKAAEELDMAAKAAGFDLPAPAALPRRAAAVSPHGSVDPSETASPPVSVGTGPEADEASQAEAAGMTPEAFRAWRKSRMWAAVTYQANMDIHEEVEQNVQLRVLHEHSEKFDLRAEGVFKYLQIFTAMANSFGHGSNNVSNAVGPLAAIYGVWLTSSVSEESQVPVWILVLGGVGFVVGLATFGYKIMSVLGVKMTRLTSSRGFVVEFSTSIIILTATRFGLPLSTTHTLVGAVTGIGLLEGKRGLNRVLLIRFFAGWVATLVVAALTAAAFTAQGIYAPNRGMDSQRSSSGTYLTSSAWNVAQGINNTAVRDAVLAQIMALPNWNASSPDWKPLLYLGDAVAAQLAALQGYGVPVCGSAPSGAVEC